MFAEARSASFSAAWGGAASAKTRLGRARARQLEKAAVWCQRDGQRCGARRESYLRNRHALFAANCGIAATEVIVGSRDPEPEDWVVSWFGDLWSDPN